MPKKSGSKKADTIDNTTKIDCIDKNDKVLSAEQHYSSCALKHIMRVINKGGLCKDKPETIDKKIVAILAKKYPEYTLYNNEIAEVYPDLMGPYYFELGFIILL